MKRIAALLLVAGILFSMTACGQKMEIPDDRLAGLAQESVANMQSGNFTAVEDNLSKTFQKQMNTDKIKETWTQVTGKLGSFVKNEDAKVISQEKYATVMVVSEFQKNGVQTSLSYDSKGRIIGLQVNYFPLETTPEQTAAFSEKDLVLGGGDHPLQARLTLPTNTKKPPLVVFVQGSGASDLDETIGAAVNKPFKDIAHGLAEKGIASLRYDKRFFTYPELGIKEAESVTIEAEVLDDVTALLKMAGNQPVDTGRIYLLGHSMGGMLAPKIAQDNPSIHGIISLAGTPRQLEDLILDQNTALINAESTLSDKEKKQYIEQIQKQVDGVKAITDKTKVSQMLTMPTTYWNSLNKIHAGEIAGKLRIPMLFAQGTADIQVSPDKDFGEWKKLLAGKDKVSFKEFDGLNHIFMKSNGAKDVSEYDTEGHVAQQVIDDIAAWILAN